MHFYSFQYKVSVAIGQKLESTITLHSRLNLLNDMILSWRIMILDIAPTFHV